MKIWENRKDLEKISNLKVYLYVATRNISLNYLEKNKHSATNAAVEIPLNLSGFYFDPEQLMITADMMARIQQAVDKLPLRCRLIFRMVKEDRLKYREVAEILEISIKTVENQIAIALKKISEAVRFDISTSISSSFNRLG